MVSQFRRSRGGRLLLPGRVNAGKSGDRDRVQPAALGQRPVELGARALPGILGVAAWSHPEHSHRYAGKLPAVASEEPVGVAVPASGVQRGGRSSWRSPPRTRAAPWPAMARPAGPAASWTRQPPATSGSTPPVTWPGPKRPCVTWGPPWPPWPARAPEVRLAEIELTVAGLVAEGLSNPQIGERLYVSRRAVQTHLAHIFAKLDISSPRRPGGRPARRLADHRAPARCRSGRGTASVCRGRRHIG